MIIFNLDLSPPTRPQILRASAVDVPGRQANACILAFDVTRKITYKNLETFATQYVWRCPRGRKLLESIHRYPSNWGGPVKNACHLLNIFNIFLRACLLCQLDFFLVA